MYRWPGKSPLNFFSHAELACPEFSSGFQHLLDHYTDPEINSG